MGLHRAGFEVVGVDIEPQPHYPFEFHQADAMTYPLEGFDAYWASPPCQGYSTMNTHLNASLDYPRLIPEVLAMLKATGKRWVVENVVGAPLPAHIQLCGSVFGLGSHGYQLRRHRWFESNILIVTPGCHHKGRAISIVGGPKVDRLTKRVPASWGHEAMGIDWMNREELSEAIPPAYSNYIGEQLLRAPGASSHPRLVPVGRLALGTHTDCFCSGVP